MKVDLSKYDLTSCSTHPYLSVEARGEMFHVYEGAFGKRYRYFRIRSDSSIGEMCREFRERYFVRNEYRYTYYEDGQELFKAAEQADGVKKLSGVRAYYKYWNKFSDREKAATRLVVIPHFRALREWYRLKYAEMLGEKSGELVNRKVREAYVRQWNRKLLEEMELYLQPPVPPVKFSLLSMAHAHELSKFYRWVSRKRLAIPSDVKVNKVKLVFNWVMNNPAIASVIGAVALPIGTWIVKLVIHIFR